MATQAQIDQITSLQNILAKLDAGDQEVMIRDSDGTEVRYQQADARALQRQIINLEVRYGLRKRGAVVFYG